MILIGLSGKKQSGKNTVAGLFSSNLPNYSCTELSFAAPLKLEVCKLMNITLGELELDKSLYRGLLQWWGTEYRRSQDKDYWIKKWLESLARVPVSTTRLIIAPDVRFANEYHTIKQLGGYLFRVKRPVKSVDNHLSECTLDEVPMAIIDNSKDLEYLEQQVINIIKRMKLI